MNADRDSEFSHLDEKGRARMVDIGDKDVTRRRAVASGRITMRPETLAAIKGGTTPKGDVLVVARIAAIQAGKETSRWIPLCHPLPVDSIGVDFDLSGEDTIRVTVEARTSGRTGVEMEALTATAAALLTIYDMCKAVDRAMTIGAIRLEEKEGGRSGRWVRQDD